MVIQTNEEGAHAIRADVNYVGEGFKVFVGVVKLQAEALFQRQ